jgi:hypothetical protein
LQAICECGKSSLEHLSVQEDQKWAREVEQYLADKKNAPAALHQGVEPSAAYKAFAKAGCSKEFLREYVHSCSSRKEKIVIILTDTLARKNVSKRRLKHLPTGDRLFLILTTCLSCMKALAFLLKTGQRFL